MTARRIHYGTPCEFRTVTHAQLEHFDNKPPPQPLEEPEPAAKSTKSIQSEAEASKLTQAQAKSEAKKRSSEGNTSTVPGKTKARQTDEEEWNPDEWGGWDGHVTKYDASTMYLG